MADRRASASKAYTERKKKEEQEKARAAVLNAAKRDVTNAKSAVGASEKPAYRTGMKNANAGKASDQTVKSPGSNKKIKGNTTRADAQAGGAARQTTNRNKAKETVVGNTTRSAVEKGGAARRAANENQAAQRAYERALASQLNTPLGQMANRSTSWSMLDQTKDIAQKVHWPQSAIDKMTEKQNALHQQNVETAKPYDITFDEEKGVWRGGKSYGEWEGAQVYDAPKAQTVQTDVLNKAREEAAKFEPVNPAQMTPAQKALYNLAKTRGTTQGMSRAIESLTGHLPGRFGSGTESVLKGLAAWPYAFGETLDQSIADAKTNWNNDTLANLNAQAAQLQREMNVRGLPASVRQEKLAQYNQLRAQIDVLSAKNSVDMSLPGQVMMGEAGQASAQTLDGLSGWQRSLANAGLSIGQNLPNLAVSAVAGPGVGLAMMAGQAGTQKMYELNARGIPADESLARGLVSGGIEALTEKIPLENFLNVARTGGVGAVKNVLKQMGIEATEEGASYAMNWAADKAAQDPEATFSLQELASSMAGGALSGGIMGGAGTLLNGAVNLPGKIAEKTQGTKPAPLPVANAQETENVQPVPLPVRETQDSQAFGQETPAQPKPLPKAESSKSLNDRIRENSELIEKGGIISELTGQEFANGEKKLLDQVTDFFKSIGNKVVRNGFGEVTLTRSGARDSLSHGVGREKAIAFAAVPDVIQRGQIIDEQLNWKGRGYDTVTFGGRIKIAGQDYDMGVIVKRYDNPEMASKYYVHEVLLRNKEGEATTFKTGTLSGYPSDVTSPSAISIPQAGADSKPQGLPVDTAQDAGNVQGLPVQGMQDMSGQTGSYDDFMRPLTGLRDKLASDLQNARQILPGPGTESRIRELESGLADVKKQIAAMEKNRPQFVEAQRIAEVLGAKFQVADLGAANGRYKNGTITVNPYTENPVRQVLVHEMTHYLETSGEYGALSGRVLDFIAQDMRTDVQAMQDEIIRDYAKYGVTLDGDGAKRELVAKFCEEKLFTDEASIQRLAQTDQTLFQRIRQWISDTIAKLRGTKQENALREMERLYEKAARTAGEQAGYAGAQYSIETLPDGEKIAVINTDQDEFYGKPVQSFSAIARRMLLGKFKGQVLPLGEGDLARFRAKQAGEYTYPSNPIDVHTPEYEAKMRASAELDNLLSTAEYSHWAKDYKNHPEATLGFDYYKIRFIVGGHLFEGLANIANSEKGRIFYDITKIKEIPASSGKYATLLAQSTSTFGNLINSSIPQTGQNGNTSGQNSMGLSFGELRDNVRGTRESRSDVALQGEARTLMDAWNAKKQTEKQAERIKNGLTLTKRDIMLAQTAAKSGVDTINWEQADNPEPAFLYGKALADVREADRPLREFMAKRQEELQGNAREAADWIATFAKDKRLGLSYQRETMERNIRDIFGEQHRDVADDIIRDYITPVHTAVAEGNRIKNRYRDRVKKLNLTKHESALVQMRLEGESGAEAEYIANNNIRVTPEMDAKISRAAETFRAIYNDLYEQINTTLLRNGQEPAPFRKNYAPHFVKDKPDTMLGKIRFALGLGKDSSLSLPTDIAGITDEFRPGKKWFGNLLQREGEITDYDAVAGFDRYIETAADVITLTDSIQRLRALEDETRYALSDEGVKDRIDAIRADDALDPLEQRRQMEEIYGDNPTTAQQLIADLQNQKRMGMGGFVTELRRYTDNLAGKKSKEDRGWEQALGRQVYTIAKNMEGRTAANMLALNPASWLTNFIPITQASGEVSTVNLLAGMKDTVKAFVKDDGFADASDFLTNREGSSRLDQTLTERMSGASNAGMELVDRIASQTIVRGRYRQNVQNGMDMVSAMEDADAFAAGLMADRSKGAQPTLFNATNPVAKTLTMFQVEVNNQLSYLFKDMPQAQKQKGILALAGAYTKVFVGAHAYNIVFHALTGRDAALDPIGWILDALGIDDVAWIMDKLGIGGGDDDDEDKKERTGFDIAESLGKNVAENLPFVGGLLGGGRVPIQAALPNVFTMYDSWKSDAAPEKKAQTIGKELSKPATYLLPPFGGGAVRRAVEGYQAVSQGGVYGMDNEGNKTLNFPVYGQKPQDYAKAMLFGKYSLPTGQKYVDSGFEGKLNAKETGAFEALRGADGTIAETVYEAIRGLGNMEAEKDADGKTVVSRKELQRRALFENSSLTAKQKETLDRMLLVSGEDETPADYSNEDAFRITSELESGQQKRAFRALDAGISADTYISTRESFPENAKKADKIQAIFERNDLDAGQKAELEEIMLGSDEQETYYPADYTNEQTLALSTHVRPGTDTHMSQKHREKAIAGAQAGVSEELYMYAWDEIGNMESSEVDGRSVGDVSYKKKVFIDALTQDSTQRQYLYEAFGVSKKAQSGAQFVLYGEGENPVEAYRKNLVITYGK